MLLIVVGSLVILIECLVNHRPFKALLIFSGACTVGALLLVSRIFWLSEGGTRPWQVQRTLDGYTVKQFRPGFHLEPIRGNILWLRPFNRVALQPSSSPAHVLRFDLDFDNGRVEEKDVLNFLRWLDELTYKIEGVPPTSAQIKRGTWKDYSEHLVYAHGKDFLTFNPSLQTQE